MQNGGLALLGSSSEISAPLFPKFRLFIDFWVPPIIKSVPNISASILKKGMCTIGNYALRKKRVPNPLFSECADIFGTDLIRGHPKINKLPKFQKWRCRNFGRRPTTRLHAQVFSSTVIALPFPIECKPIIHVIVQIPFLWPIQDKRMCQGKMNKASRVHSGCPKFRKKTYYEASCTSIFLYCNCIAFSYRVQADNPCNCTNSFSLAYTR